MSKPIQYPTLQCTSEPNQTNERTTYLVGASKVSNEDKKRIEGTWGKLIIPKGETDRAKEIRKQALAWQQSKIDQFNRAYDTWIKNNPDADEETKKEWRKKVDNVIDRTLFPTREREYLKLNKFDWREHDINVGPVMNQGESCSTCWAFASTSAVFANMQKNYFDNLNRESYFLYPDKPGVIHLLKGAIKWDLGNPSPFVQDLLNCMPIKKEDICNEGWHGNVFDFMVYKKGIPMAYEDGYIENVLGKNNEIVSSITHHNKYVVREKFECNPSDGFRKAVAWDYVSSPPDKLPSVEELKTALVKHGPIVVPIHYDSCFQKYRGGIFNEKNNRKINHVILLLGWNDSKQAWLIKNSWDEDWGEKGFGWVKYGSNNIGVFAAWIETASGTWSPSLN